MSEINTTIIEAMRAKGRIEFGGKDLCGADLRDADLRDAKGVIRLPVGDPRGYDAYAVAKDGEWMIKAGCRYLELEQAIAHWGQDYSGHRETGDQYLYAIEWLQKKIGTGVQK